MDLTSSDLKKIQQNAEKIAMSAGRILLTHKNKFKILTHKNDLVDIATDADYMSEKYIVSNLRKLYPSHNIFSEEHNWNLQSSDFEWFIDPLDGTKEYVRNVPNYMVNITLEYRKELIIAVTFQPETQRLYSSGKELGSRLNNNLIHPSKESGLNKSLVSIRIADFRMSKIRLSTYTDLFTSLVKNTYRIRANVWDVEALCFVAMGALEGYILPSYKAWHPGNWWDYAAGILIVQEAGGKVTDFFGNPIRNRNLSKGIIASNGKIHDELLKLVKNYF